MFCYWVGVCSLLLLWWNAVGDAFILKSAYCAPQWRERRSEGAEEKDLCVSDYSGKWRQLVTYFLAKLLRVISESLIPCVCLHVSLHRIRSDQIIQLLWQVCWSPFLIHPADFILTNCHSKLTCKPDADWFTGGKWLTCQSNLPTHNTSGGKVKVWGKEIIFLSFLWSSQIKGESSHQGCTEMKTARWVSLAWVSDYCTATKKIHANGNVHIREPWFKVRFTV